MIRSGELLIHDSLRPFLMDIDTLQQHPENYNNGDEEEIEKSLRTNGMAVPIPVQAGTRYIIGGNHVWAVCKALHATVIPAYLLDVDDIEAKRLMIALNETARRAMPDRSGMLDLLHQIKDEHPVSIVGTGVTEKEMERLEELEQMPLDLGPYQHYIPFTLDLPRDLIAAFRRMTREADTDRDRFELLLRLAGWDGK